MATERNDLLELAARVADGDAVDWDQLTSTESDFVRRRTLQRLRVIASIAGAHSSDSGMPDRWGPLQLESRLGAGAFGTVYVALDPALDRRVALKLFDPELTADQALRARLLAEGPRLARVRHPNVVTVFGAAEHNARLGLWMELVEGRTLRAWVGEHGALGSHEAGALTIELCRALAAVHAAGLLHRDIKADNVVREAGGRVVLMDFGAGVDRYDANAESLTTGTPLYMAPELLAGSPASVQSEIYALGVLLYFLLSGRYPIEAATVGALKEALQRGHVVSLRDRRPGLSPAFLAVVERAMASDPSKRFATVGAMEQALVAALGNTSPRRLNAWLLGIGALAAAITMSILVRQRITARPATENAAIRAERSVASPATPAFGRLRVSASLLRQGSGAWLTDELTTGGRVRVGDRLQLRVTTDEPAHVYVINRDRVGRMFVLFPLAAAMARNPLAPHETHLLPGEVGGAKRQWRVDTAGGRESFLLIASRQPLSSLDHAIASLSEPASREPLRGVGELSPAEPAPGDAALAQVIESLQRSAKDDGDVWLEEIVVDNDG